MTEITSVVSQVIRSDIILKYTNTFWKIFITIFHRPHSDLSHQLDLAPCSVQFFISHEYCNVWLQYWGCWWPLLTPHPGVTSGCGVWGTRWGHLVITREHWDSHHQEEWPLGEINWGRTWGMMIKYKYSNIKLASVSGTRLFLWFCWWSNNWKVWSSEGHLWIQGSYLIPVEVMETCWETLPVYTSYRFL